MPRMRTESIASLRQVRTAALWAMAFSAGAAVTGLAAPLALIHAFAAAASQDAVQTVAAVMAVVLSALLARSLFIVARDRLLERAALWLAHTLAADLLATGIDRLVPPTDIDRNRTALDRLSAALPRLAHVFDGMLAILPAGLALLVAPLPAMVTLAAMAMTLAPLLHRLTRIRRLVEELDNRSTAADRAWRTAVASSVTIAARGLTPSVVQDWQTLNGRAVGRTFTLAQESERLARWQRSVSDVTLVAVLAACIWSAGTGGLTPGAMAACVYLHIECMSRLAAAVRALPDLLLAERARATLRTALQTAAPFAVAPAATAASDRPRQDTPSRGTTHHRAEAS